MAPLHAIADRRGSAAIEAAAVAGVLAVFAAGVLMTVYLLFARAWLQYQTEQALYCLAERRGTAVCRSRLSDRARAFLPYGNFRTMDLRAERGRWIAEVGWEWQGYTLHLSKRLTPGLILKNRVLP
jgi:hypothetical protein